MHTHTHSQADWTYPDVLRHILVYTVTAVGIKWPYDGWGSDSMAIITSHIYPPLTESRGGEKETK